MSYVVKNCPAITEYKFPDKVHKDCCQCKYGYCKDINCVIKQVIELCKEYDKEQAEWCEPIPFCTDNIYDLFDIKEINKCS